VVIINIDHQALKQIPHLIGHFDLQLLQFPLQKMVGDVVVREKGHSLGLQPLANASAQGLA